MVFGPIALFGCPAQLHSIIADQYCGTPVSLHDAAASLYQHNHCVEQFDSFKAKGTQSRHDIFFVREYGSSWPLPTSRKIRKKCEKIRGNIPNLVKKQRLKHAGEKAFVLNGNRCPCSRLPSKATAHPAPRNVWQQVRLGKQRTP